ncbi:MAG: orotate phosphoribosyltransferase [Candidatus Coatesbacteria bacterium]|nr:orotate phosphoribosyltransferase [Candidatus Coatesbacteria bacterium]
MEPRERLLELLRELSLKRGHFKLSSGGTSEYYVDCKMTTLSPEGLNLVGRLVVSRLAELGVRHVGGMTLGADPIASAAAALSWDEGYPVDAFIVRKQVKGHGTGKQIEGPLPEGARVVVVEDVTTTGRSALEAAAAVEAHGCEVVEVLTLLDRMEGGKENIEAKGYKVFAFFNRDELLKEA